MRARGAEIVLTDGEPQFSHGGGLAGADSELAPKSMASRFTALC